MKTLTVVGVRDVGAVQLDWSRDRALALLQQSSASASLSPQPETLTGVGSVMVGVYGGSGHPTKLHGASWPAQVYRAGMSCMATCSGNLQKFLAANLIVQPLSCQNG